MFKLSQSLQDKITAKNADYVLLRNTLMQGEAQTQRSLNEIKWSLMEVIGRLDPKRAA